MGLYVCGPTVYDFLHIGNYRGAIFFNMVRLWLEHLGYKVTYVYNYTDVDDKIIDRSKKENISCQKITEQYIAEFEKDYTQLGLTAHTHRPRCTQYIKQMIQFIQNLFDKNCAYQLGGDVYFNVQNFKAYGQLTNKNLDDLRSGTRADTQQGKKHAADFVLWKGRSIKTSQNQTGEAAQNPSSQSPASQSPAGEAAPNSSLQPEPSWPSPWGAGRPGWHIECSTMAQALLGDQIDIHGGGMDLAFPHHENERAQSEASTGRVFVKYWMHHNMLELGSQKMSKSLGNIKTGRAFLNEYGGEVLKFMMLSHHYRSPIDFSAAQINRAVISLAQFYSSLAKAEKFVHALANTFVHTQTSTQESAQPPSSTHVQAQFVNEKINITMGRAAMELPAPQGAQAFDALLKSSQHHIALALCDDFNTPVVFSLLFESMNQFHALVPMSLLSAVRSIQTPAKLSPPAIEALAAATMYAQWLPQQGHVMALFGQPPQKFLQQMDDKLLAEKNLTRDQINQLVAQRSQARQNKDWAAADRLRDELSSLGILLQDLAHTTEWEVQKKTSQVTQA